MARRFHTPLGSQGSARLSGRIVRPAIEIEIFGEHGTFGPRRPFDPTRDLVEATVSKTLEDPTGTCILTLTPGVSGAPAEITWLDLLEVMDFVVVRMSADAPGSPGSDPVGGGWRTVFVGYVQSVEEEADFSSSQGEIQRSVQVTCCDMSYGFTYPEFVIPPFIVDVVSDTRGLPAAKEWLKQFELLQDSAIAGSAGPNPNMWLPILLSQLFPNQASQAVQLHPGIVIREIIQRVLPILFNPVTTLSLPGAAGDYTFVDMLNLAIADLSAFSFAAFNIGPFDQNLWQILQSMTNPPFFELFVDVRSSDQTSDLVSGPGGGFLGTGQPEGSSSSAGNPFVGYVGSKAPPVFGPDGAGVYLVLRQTPFSREDWDHLIVQRLRAEDILGYVLNKDRSSVLNLYETYPEAINQSLSGIVSRLFPGLADADSIARYGLSPAFYPIYGIVDVVSPTQYLPNVVSPYTNELYKWYWKNPKWLQGSLSVRGDPRYRIGQKLVCEDIGLEAYIEGVIHTFVAQGNQPYFQTTLEVSRGAKPGDQHRFPPTEQNLVAAINAQDVARLLNEGSS
jgi:hypothetical protein